MKTDNPKVAALMIAWKMTEKTSAGVTQAQDLKHEEKITKIREAFLENYKAIVAVANLDPAAPAGFAQGVARPQT